jgi:hypothetical protein
MLAVRPDAGTGAIVLEGVNGGMPLRQTAHEQTDLAAEL